MNVSKKIFKNYLFVNEHFRIFIKALKKTIKIKNIRIHNSKPNEASKSVKTLTKSKWGYRIRIIQ